MSTSKRFAAARLVLAAGLLFVAGRPAATVPIPERPADDVRQRLPATFLQVEPVLQKKCSMCHGDRGIFRGGLDVRTLGRLRRGGDNGPGIVPGDLQRSYVWEMIAGGFMPPQGMPALTAPERTLIRQWILQGAPER